MSRHYVLVGIEETWSKMNQCPMYRIHWYCENDDSLWEMTVDESYRNFQDRWGDFVREPLLWGRYSGLKRTAKKTLKGHRVVTADSRPICVEPLASQDESYSYITAVQQWHRDNPGQELR